ncbi:hypothetical protein [Pelistega europaea]|uniref:Uncharacterized protein n=1 Tax=Pelistega europaea TaxID=106147 RepID=A0A7Y4L9Y7_9BURK|nr:hypothetical protein [Pelistega europaea]NOL48636.1 hypothetical protein [Pelistega europaea]
MSQLRNWISAVSPEALKQRLSTLYKDKNIGELEYQEVMGWVEHPDAALSQHGEALLCYTYLSIPTSQTEENQVADNHVSAHNQALWEHLNQLAEQGLAAAQYYISRCYYEGDFVKGDK